MAELKKLTDENYEEEVINSKDIWCVTFSALSFCQPCKMLHPVIENIAKNDKVPGVKFGLLRLRIQDLKLEHFYGNKRCADDTCYAWKRILGTKVGFVPERFS